MIRARLTDRRVIIGGAAIVAVLVLGFVFLQNRRLQNRRASPALDVPSES